MVIPPILDACCGGKKFYFDKNSPFVLYQDFRSETLTLCDGRQFNVSPDVVADFRHMPYPDDTFQMVVFDPPHLKFNGTADQVTGWQFQSYGFLPADSWRDYLREGLSECFRVLKPNGFLIFKWNETDIRVSEILKLTSEQPILGHRSGKAQKTHWLLFIKKKIKN